MIMYDLGCGLLYMHEKAHTVNRDIKPDNMLYATKKNGTDIYSHDRAQISDFTLGITLPKD